MIASGWRPDPTRGVFETLLVVRGEPVELEAHLHRLAQTLDAVYSKELPPQAEEELRRAAEGIPLGRLRFTVVPAGDGLRVDLLAEGVDSETVFPTASMKLRTHPIRGGLGAHKWVDRQGIDRPAPGEAGTLLVDEGEVLEAGWANVFAVRGGTLFTPPLDGRILPGTTRAALLALAAETGVRVAERAQTVDDLLAAEETFLSGSIRGIEPAQELDGKPLTGDGPISHRLAAALQQRWGLTNDSGDPAAPATALKAGLLSR
jgi:branched-subunit amino acid aminotransferase/4-amino-4-deoxychorismate lyase